MGVADKVKSLIGGHKDQSKEAIDKAAQIAEKKEGHGSQINSVADKAKDEVDKLD